VTAPAPPPGSPAARLFAEPWGFDFFQAVRLLERLAPAARPVGGDGPPAAEPVRFRAHQSLSFPPSAISGLTGGDRPAMTVAFFGLTGPLGTMPRAYTELLGRLTTDPRAAEPFALRDWFDLFNHRLLSLFYRAWAKYRYWVPQERGEPHGPVPDTFTVAVRSLVGLGTGGLLGRGKVVAPPTGRDPGPPRTLASVPDDTVLYYAGHFAHRPRNPAGLEAVLSDYLGVPVKVELFRGQWLPVGDGDRAALRVAGRLGDGAVLGERVWDVQGKFRVRVGPVGEPAFRELLPDPTPVPTGKRFALLLHLIRLYAGPEFDVEVQVVLLADEVPACRLPRSTAPGPRLGRDAWLRSMTPRRDAGDAVFTAAEADR
jgi:type VI secretion system protein ImpH